MLAKRKTSAAGCFTGLSTFLTINSKINMACLLFNWEFIFFNFYSIRRHLFWSLFWISSNIPNLSHKHKKVQFLKNKNKKRKEYQTNQWREPSRRLWTGSSGYMLSSPILTNLTKKKVLFIISLIYVIFM